MNKGMEISEIMKSPEYARLNVSQKAFVTRFISSADILSAVKYAYANQSPASARTFAYALLKNPRVTAVLNLRRGLTEVEVILSDLKILLKRAQRKGAETCVLAMPLLRVEAELKILRENESEKKVG